MKIKQQTKRNGAKAAIETTNNPLPMIAFDKAGNLIAGIEYLEAMVKSGKAAYVNVAVGCDSVADAWCGPASAIHSNARP